MFHYIIRFLSVAVLCLVLPIAAAQASDIKITNAYAYPVAEGGSTGAVFMTLTYTPTEPADQLILAETPVAGWVEIHATVIEKDIMQMRPIGVFRLPPTGTAELKPGGVHLMLMGMKQPLNGGDTFPVTLTFEKAGTMTLDVPVKVFGQIEAKDKPHVHDSGHAH